MDLAVAGPVVPLVARAACQPHEDEVQDFLARGDGQQLLAMAGTDVHSAAAQACLIWSVTTSAAGLDLSDPGRRVPWPTPSLGGLAVAGNASRIGQQRATW